MKEVAERSHGPQPALSVWGRTLSGSQGRVLLSGHSLQTGEVIGAGIHYTYRDRVTGRAGGGAGQEGSQPVEAETLEQQTREEEEEGTVRVCGRRPAPVYLPDSTQTPQTTCSHRLTTTHSGPGVSSRRQTGSEGNYSPKERGIRRKNGESLIERKGLEEQLCYCTRQGARDGRRSVGEGRPAGRSGSS